MSFSLVQQLLFGRRIWECGGDHKPLARAIPFCLQCHLFFHFYLLFQGSFSDCFGPPVISSPGLTFHSVLYPSLPDVVPFPGTLCAGFRSARSGITGVIDKGLRAPPGPRENSLCPVWLLSLTRQRFVTLSHLQSCSAGAELCLCLILRAALVLCCDVWPRMPEKLW